MFWCWRSIHCKCYTHCLRLIARYLDNLLELVLKHISRYTLKKSFEFVDEVKHQKDNDTFLCLFDVPVNEVIDICADTLSSLKNPIF